jgi:hypothetical protein
MSFSKLSHTTVMALLTQYNYLVNLRAQTNVVQVVRALGASLHLQRQ